MTVARVGFRARGGGGMGRQGFRPGGAWGLHEGVCTFASLSLAGISEQSQLWRPVIQSTIVTGSHLEILLAPLNVAAWS